MRTQPAISTPPRLAVQRLDHTHLAARAEFFHRAWSAAPAPLRAETPDFGVSLDGRLIGYIGTLPVRFWDGTEEPAGHWMKGLMVLPEHRSGGVGFWLLKEAVRHLGVAGSLSVAPAARRLFEAVGLREVGVLSNQITVLRPWRVLQVLDPGALGLERLPKALAVALRLGQRTGVAAVAGLAAGGLLGLWRWLTRRAARHLRAAPQRPDPEQLDALWRQVRPGLAAGVVRDGAHFGQYGDGYRFIAVHAAGQLRGVAVVRQPRGQGDPRLRGIRVAVLADLLVHPGRRDVLLALLREAEAAARAAGADALLCSASHRTLRQVLRRQLYVAFPGNVRFLLRATDHDARLHARFDDWWLMRGDGGADGAF